MMHLEADVFRKFDKQWALVTAGTPEHYNTMTISWGGLGTLWRRPVATVYVKKNRYTFEFMEQNDYFTVSFYPEAQRRALSLLDQIPRDVQDIFYRDEPVHRMYIGEVVDIIGNESLANRP